MYTYYELISILKKDTSFSFNSSINCDTAQGACGILTCISEKQPDNKGSIVDCRELILEHKTNSVFYKFGNNGDNCTLARQEYVIADSISKTCSHFPNFLRPILYMKNYLVRTDKCKDPFDVDNTKNKNNINCVDVVLFEYIQKSTTFWKIIKNKDISSDCKNSLILQVFIAVLAAQQNVQFVHNDLHGNNILVVKCDKNLKILYRIKILNQERYFLVPTFGLIPIIIDYGFSYTNECENMSLECADLDNYGLITYQFDSISDFIRLCVSLTKLSHNKNLSQSLLLLFKPLPISLKKSWEDRIVTEYSLYKVEKIFKRIFFTKIVENKLSEKHADQVLKLLMRNILLPVKYNEEYKDVNLEQNLEIFFSEWGNIDKWLKYKYEKIFVLREFLDALRRYGYEDMNKINKELNKAILHISKREFPLNSDIQKLIDSLKNIIGGFQNILFANITLLDSRRKLKLYKVLKSGEHIFEYFCKHLMFTDFTINPEDNILLIDNIDKKNVIIEPKIMESFQSAEEIYNLFDKINES